MQVRILSAARMLPWQRGNASGWNPGATRKDAHVRIVQAAFFGQLAQSVERQVEALRRRWFESITDHFADMAERLIARPC